MPPRKSKPNLKGKGRLARDTGFCDPKATPENFATLTRQVKRSVDQELARFRRAQLKKARAHGPVVTEMTSAVFDLCERGGKRLRPALATLGFRAAAPNADGEHVVMLGVALELLQGYLLIHDDLMDEDDVRRGGPAVHAQLRRSLGSKALGWASGILGGDYAAALALEALALGCHDPTRAVDLMLCFAAMQRDAVFGQQRDIVAQSDDVEHTYALKTASYTVRGPLHLGALAGGAKPDLLKALDDFALPAGVAFQLRDDLIGAFGNSETTGKPQGHDLKSGKNTLLLVRALERVKGKQKRALKTAFANPNVTHQELKLALEALEGSGARGAIEERIRYLTGRANKALSRPAVPATTRRLLGEALQALTARDR